MAYFSPFTTIESKAQSTNTIPLKEGQFLMTTDTKNIFYDLSGNRIQLTDILELNTESERQGLIAPVNKFYFVKGTGTLWRYNNGTWLKWSDDGGGGAGGNSISTVLTAAGWVNGRQTVSISGLTAAQDGLVGLSQNVTDAEKAAATAADMYVCAQAGGSFTVAVGGVQPSCDIPITVILISSAGNGSAIANKQDKLTGSAGQVVSFNAAGEAVPLDMEDVTEEVTSQNVLDIWNNVNPV